MTDPVGSAAQQQPKEIAMTATILDQAETLDELVFQALGAASMCWETPEGAGVFDSTRAKAIGDELVARIREAERAPVAIDADPEFFHGLTLWSADQPDGYPAFAAQVRQSAVDLVFNERRDDGHVGSRFEQEIPLADARRLRDLLNVATARGYL